METKKCNFIKSLDNWLIEPTDDSFEKVIDSLLELDKNGKEVVCINIYKTISLLKNSDIMNGYMLQHIYSNYCKGNSEIAPNTFIDELSIKNNPEYINYEKEIYA